MPKLSHHLGVKWGLTTLCGFILSTTTLFGVVQAASIVDLEKYHLPEVPSLYLDVMLNGVARGMHPFELRDDQLWGSVSTLQAIGLQMPPTTEAQVELMKLQGVNVNYQPEKQLVALMVGEERAKLPTNVFSNLDPQYYQASSTNGLLLNYDFFTSHNSDVHAGSLFTELHAFSAWGTLTNTALNYFWDSADSSVDTIRLDTTLSTSWQDRMVTVRAGDNVTSNLNWSRGTRFGGIQITRNFNLNPHLVTTPLLEFIGSTVTPSNVDLLIDGNRQYSTSVPAGPFIINTLPKINGYGNAQLVVTDALGQSRIINVPLFYSPNLLKQGLADWSLEAGKVRLNYGQKSFDYSNDLMASSKIRYGLSSDVTVESQMEGTKDLFKGGVGFVAVPSIYGAFSTSYSQSWNGSRSGNQRSFSYNWSNQYFNVGGALTRASGDYRDVASLYGADLPRKVQQLFAGTSMGQFGNLSMSHVIRTSAERETSRFVNASWFKNISRSVSLNVLLNRNLDNHRDYSVYLGMSVNLENGLTASASTTYRPDEREVSTLSINRNAPSDGGLQWRVSGEAGGGNDRAQLDLDYLTQYASFRAGANTRSDLYAGVQGSLIMMQGQTFMTKELTDSFALVSTTGVADVPVLLENRVIGATDDEGFLLVSPLYSYQKNQLSIDPLELPSGYVIDYTKTYAVPADRTGVFVPFPIQPNYSMVATLVDPQGNPLPVGTEIFIQGREQSYPVGYDGTVYLEGLSNNPEIEAHLPNGKRFLGGEVICYAKVAYRVNKEDIAQSSRTECVPAK